MPRASTQSSGSTATTAGEDIPLERLLELVNKKKATESTPLLKRLAEVETEGEEIRKQLKGMGVKVPPRILVEVEEEHENNVMLALLNSNGKGRSVKELCIDTGYTNSRMTAIRENLTKASPKLISEKKGKGLSLRVTLTADGEAEAKTYAATADGKTETAAQAERQAAAKAAK